MAGGTEGEVGTRRWKSWRALDLSEAPVQRLVEMLHEHSVNGVILSARHAYFEQVEAAIRACELEGVEAWLVADFFKTQISRTSFDDFYGWPVLVFRSTPESSWREWSKQLMDLLGSLLALLFGWWLLRADRPAHQAHFAGARVVPPAAVRDQWPALHDLQVPHHGDQRRAAQARAGRDERNERPGLQGDQ